MLAESVHSVADSGDQVLLLLGRARAERAETEQHPFGFGAERYFYAFLVAVVLFVVGAVFSCYEGIERILHPEKLTSAVVAFAVLGIAIVLESFSLRTAVKESGESRGDASWRSFIRHAKAPELPAVLLEDVAALSGLMFALVGRHSGNAHQRRPMGRSGLAGDRAAARLRRRGAGDRDEEPAHRRVSRNGRRGLDRGCY